jgi:hypothetical protein
VLAPPRVIHRAVDHALCGLSDLDHRDVQIIYVHDVKPLNCCDCKGIADRNGPSDEASSRTSEQATASRRRPA